jgi:hypothetical protein
VVNEVIVMNYTCSYWRRQRSQLARRPVMRNAAKWPRPWAYELSARIGCIRAAVSCASVSSAVVVSAVDRDCLHLGSGCGPGRHGYRRARQDGSGYTERYDGGDDESSPDAHGSLQATTEVSDQVSCSANLSGASI